MNPEREVDKRTIAVIQGMTDDTLLLTYLAGYRGETNLDRLDPIVKAVLEGRLLTRIADSTKELGTITQQSQQEVKRLADSSETVERLTRTLRNLTWVLIFLTFGAAAVPIGIELWKTQHESAVAPPPAPPQP